MPNLVNLESVRVSRGTRTILDGISLGVQTGDRIGVLGLNGSGKTTLLGVLSGELAPQDGRVATARGTRIEAVAQSAEPPADAIVRGVALGEFTGGEHTWASDSAVREVLDGLGLAAIGLDSAMGTLSGGERRRVMLAAALVTDADLLLLDEPTNHLDIEGISWLIGHLLARRSALVVVTHDRFFLDAVATTTWEVTGGQVLASDGGYSDWVFARAERLRLAGAAEDRRRNLARKELAWLRRGAPARTAKPRYRIEAAEALISDVPEPRNAVELHAFARRRLGRDVLDVEDVTLALPGGRVLLDEVTWRIGPGDRLAVVGVNGSGKSTLLRLLAGTAPPQSGRVRTGQTVRLGFLPQEASELPADVRVLEAVTEIAGTVNLGGKDLTASQLAERFGFTPAQQWTRIAELSGGERRRLQLLRVLMAEPNVLLLDEPTNDLDVDTLASLEDLLDGWPGTLVAVSHDRYLVERIADSVYALLGDGGLTHLPGGIEQYLRLRREFAERTATQSGSAAPGSARAVNARPSGNAAAGKANPSESADRRALRKDLQRLERRLESLRRKESDLGERMVAVGSDYTEAARLDVRLAQVRADRAAAEEQWLAVAEDLEQA